MANTTLSVTVYGGVSPEDIIVTFFKNGIEVPANEFQSPESFQKMYTDLDSGIYDIYVGGVNPLAPSAATKCEITTDEIALHPANGTPIINTGKMYLTHFSFTV